MAFSCFLYLQNTLNSKQYKLNTNTYFFIALNIWKFVPKNYDLRTALIFYYHLKKTAAESHRMLVEACGGMPLVNHSALSGLKNSKVAILTWGKKNLQVPRKRPRIASMLDEDDVQTQKQLADQLNVTREAVSIRFKAMGKIQKVRKWVPYELNERQRENRKNTCECCFIYLIMIFILRIFFI